MGTKHFRPLRTQEPLLRTAWTVIRSGSKYMIGSMSAAVIGTREHTPGRIADFWLSVPAMSTG